LEFFLGKKPFSLRSIIRVAPCRAVMIDPHLFTQIDATRMLESWERFAGVEFDRARRK
jgi:hypothetical protein